MVVKKAMYLKVFRFCRYSKVSRKTMIIKRMLMEQNSSCGKLVVEIVQRENYPNVASTNIYHLSIYIDRFPSFFSPLLVGYSCYTTYDEH